MGILAAAILSILINPVLFALLDWYLRKPEQRGDADGEGAAEPARIEIEPTSLTGHAVLVGYGRVGSVVSKALQERAIPFLLIEANDDLAAAAKASGMPAVADDSGLEVAALGGAPGIHSARWGGPNKDFNLAMQRVNRELAATGSADRSAKFVCGLAYALPNGKTIVSRGAITGTLVWPPRGTRGFGYDPIFVPEGYSETFGEMDPDRKNFLSHRLRAFDILILKTWPLE